MTVTRQEIEKSIHALLLEVDKTIVDDIQSKFKAFADQIEKDLREQTKYAERYHALESAGVDNWNGYEYAQEEWRNWEDE